MALVVLQLMKAASSLSDEEGLAGRAAGLREIKSLAMYYLERRRCVSAMIGSLSPRQT
jgi:hypothetical protein